MPHPVASDGTRCCKLCVGPLCNSPKVNFKTGCTRHVTDYRPVIYGRNGRHPNLSLTLLPVSTPHVVMAPRKAKEAPTVWPFWLVHCKTCFVSSERSNTIYLFCQQRICICVFSCTGLFSELSAVRSSWDPVQEMNITAVKPKVHILAVLHTINSACFLVND